MQGHFEKFIKNMTELVDRAGDDETQILNEGKKLVGDLVSRDDWLPDEYANPHPEYYQQYLLYCAPDKSFSIVSFVWGPGQKTPIHDHTVWGLIGMLRGGEIEESFTLSNNGEPVKRTEMQRLEPGMVGAVSPTIGDVHRVSNVYDDRVSISIHVYGADIGSVSRHVFNEENGEAKTFISGYANSNH